MKKVDPGPLSFLQPGWFAFHAAAIGGMLAIGRVFGKRS
jgi:hypothetical protein